MKKITFLCICKEKYFLISSFKGNDLKINICNKCHSYYTKKKKISNLSIMVKKFNLKYENYFKK